jgi:hypothetical protein
MELSGILGSVGAIGEIVNGERGDSQPRPQG